MIEFSCLSMDWPEKINKARTALRWYKRGKYVRDSYRESKYETLSFLARVGDGRRIVRKGVTVAKYGATDEDREEARDYIKNAAKQKVMNHLLRIPIIPESK